MNHSPETNCSVSILVYSAEPGKCKQTCKVFSIFHCNGMNGKEIKVGAKSYLFASRQGDQFKRRFLDTVTKR